MSQPAITAENLSKAYRIGLKDEIPDSLVGAVQGLLRAPWKNWRRLNRLNTFGQNGDAEDIIWALKNVSFDVQEGVVIGIIGRNGAGKSTLLKVLSRITEPTSGRAVIRGRVSSLLEVGTGFHPELTGRENIYMNGTILGMTKREIDRKFDAIVDFSGVEKFLDTPIKRYSSGMKVRLAFSVAAHLEPEILIIDEVLAVGDSDFQKKCLGKMNEVSSSGRTVLFVSHNMGAVLDLCSVAALMELGRLTHCGPTGDVVAEYSRLNDGSNGSCFDLSSHERRRNGAPVILAGMRLLNANGVATNQFCCGEALTIELTVNPHPSFERLHLSIAFGDSLGVSLFRLATQFSSTGAIEVRDNRRIRCYLTELPLAPGEYTLSVGASSARTSIDLVEHAARLEVLPADYYGIGSVVKRRREQFLVRSQWEVNEA